MARLSLAITLVTLSLLNQAVHASNPVFGGFVTPACDACLDQAYQTCPGDYLTRSYATCLCYGDGGTVVNQCLSVCDYGINEPAHVATRWFGYCVIFFKELCAEASPYIAGTGYDSECTPEAIAAAEGESGSDSGGASSETVGATGTGAGTDPTATPIAADSTGSASGVVVGAQPTSTSGATLVPVPALAIVVGLGMQFVVDMNL